MAGRRHGQHQGIVGLAGSARLNEIMGGLLAELRLVFHVVEDQEHLHQPYLPRNRALLAMLEEGEGSVAVAVGVSSSVNVREPVPTPLSALTLKW